ncbi:MAG: NAD(P)-binding domain-containing protein, partial [Actinobacteria bacterium]|nr:NAD(P)-binding domain-containing protein [Actinomycetota bacterium]
MARRSDVAVIGAGSAGLAVLRGLTDQGIGFDCFERGSDVGGLWRYGNDNELSSAYASLRTNVSRQRMEYPSFPMSASGPSYPHHTEMASYLRAYADRFGLRERIRFATTVVWLEPDKHDGWRLTLDRGQVHTYRHVVVAIGHHWSPLTPKDPGRFCGRVSHSHSYRTPTPFGDQRVRVVGAGQSAVELALEISAVAERTCISVRHSPHVIPRWIDGRPY